MEGQHKPKKHLSGLSARPSVGSERREHNGRRSLLGAAREDGRRESLRDFGERVRDFTGQVPLVGRMSEQRRERRRIDREWEGSRGSGRRRDNWRDLGDRVRQLTGRVPLVGRMSEQRRERRRIDREWEDAASDDFDNDFRDDPRDDFGAGFPRGWDDDDGAIGDVPGRTPRATIDLGAGAMSRSNLEQRHAKQGNRLLDRGFTMRLLLVLSLVSVIVGFCCTQSTLSLVDAIAAGRDAQAQVTLLQGILKGGNYFDVDHLTEVQTHLVILQNDLNRLQSDVPWALAHAPVGSSMAHLLNMAATMVQAGRLGVDAALILLPHLKGVFSDIGSSATNSSGLPGNATVTAAPTATATATSGAPKSAAGALTMDEVARAQHDITTAGVLVQQALAERSQVSDGQLSSFGLGKIVTLLQKLDAVTPKIPTYLDYANTVMQALPNLLGLSKPAHFLLFDMDSDELRPSGGFLGNYAVLTVQGGHLVGGVHLKDVITLDCPNSSCPYNPIPSQYSWLNIDPQHFGMRDANLSPDFPTSAQMVIQQYQNESHQTVDGVVMITPEIIKDILKVTGSIKVEGFDQTVDAGNLQDVIHYYHILAGNTGVTSGSSASGTTQRKVIDTLLGSALLKKFGALDATKQSVVLRQILQSFATKDVQLFLVDSKVQAVLAGLHVDAAIPMPAGIDGLMATDANVGATYYNSDLKETVADTITFDAQGNATHDATITYTLPDARHLYTPLLLSSNITWYNDVARILVPDGAKLQDWGAVQCPTSCYQVDGPEKGHQVWAVRIQNMQRGQTVVLHFKWTAPKVVQTVNGTQQYRLQLYRQAGNHISYDITIKAPANSAIAQPLPSPFKTPAKAEPGTAAEFTIPMLAKDTLLTLSLANS